MKTISLELKNIQVSNIATGMMRIADKPDDEIRTLAGAARDAVRDLRDRELPVILISHKMPHVFDVADRIHIQRFGKCAATITPQSHNMTDAVAIMTGAATA